MTIDVTMSSHAYRLWRTSRNRRTRRTTSSHAYRLWRDEKPWGYVLKPLYDALFVWQAWDLNHCERAYVKERDRVHLPPEMRDPNVSA